MRTSSIGRFLSCLTPLARPRRATSAPPQRPEAPGAVPLAPATAPVSSTGGPGTVGQPGHPCPPLPQTPRPTPRGHHQGRDDEPGPRPGTLTGRITLRGSRPAGPLLFCFGHGDIADDDMHHPVRHQWRHGLPDLRGDLRQRQPVPGNHADLDLPGPHRHAGHGPARQIGGHRDTGGFSQPGYGGAPGHGSHDPVREPGHLRRCRVVPAGHWTRCPPRQALRRAGECRPH